MDREIYLNCICRAMFLLTDFLYAQRDVLSAEQITAAVDGIVKLTEIEKEYRSAATIKVIREG